MSDRSNSGLRGDEEPETVEQRAHAATELFKLARPAELVPEEFRDVSFGSAIGGYNRNDVDAYVERVNRLIAELEISRSPEKAVQLALERVGEQTAGILHEAQEAADKLSATAAAEAEHATRRARVEADELMESAQKESRAVLERAAEESTDLLEQSQARLEAMRGEIATAQREHVRAVDQLRRTAAALTDFADLAGGRAPARSERPPAPGEEDPAEQPTEMREALDADGDSGERRTETIDAVESPDAATDPGEQPTEKTDAAASPDAEAGAHPRRRITGARPRPAKRETAEAAARARPG